MARIKAPICPKKFIAPVTVPVLFLPISVQTAYETITPKQKKKFAIIRKYELRCFCGDNAAEIKNNPQSPKPEIPMNRRPKRIPFKRAIQSEATPPIKKPAMPKINNDDEVNFISFSEK